MSYTPYQSQVSIVATVPASVSGVGVFNVNPTGNGSIVAKLTNSSVTAYQGVTPWVVNGSVAVMSVVPHSVTALQGTNPWFVQLTSGSVITAGGNSSVQVVGIVPPSSVSGVGLFNVNPTGNGSVLVVQPDATKLTGTMSVMGNLSVLGTVPVTQSTTPWIVQLSSGSVITAGGNSSVQVVGIVPPSSVSGVGLFNVNHVGNGSIITVERLASIAGTYTEDSAHTNGERGLFTLGVRNDTVASFTSANGDYSPVGVDSAGRTIVKPFGADQSSVWGTASAVSAGTGSGVASVVLFGAPGAGLKNYITDFMISNTGAATTLVTFIDNDNSVLGKTIAPSGGGSNAIGLNFPIVNVSTNNRIGMIIGTSSSVVHVWAAGYKAP